MVVLYLEFLLEIVVVSEKYFNSGNPRKINASDHVKIVINLGLVVKEPVVGQFLDVFEYFLRIKNGEVFHICEALFFELGDVDWNVVHQLKYY